MAQERNSIAPQIIDEASEWFVAMREPSASRDQREAFAEWLRASPVHVRAYLETVRVWGDAAHLSAECDANLSALIDATQATPNIVQLREGAVGPCAGDDQADHRQLRSSPRLVRIAASILITCGIAAGIGTWWWQIHAGAAFVTDVGEHRVITLEDGSIARLNARSKMRVRMSPDSREVDLLEGQALFEVKKNPQRPFVVHSGSTAVRAVGTAFDVNRKSTGTVVSVVEGRVEVRSHRFDGFPSPSRDARKRAEAFSPSLGNCSARGNCPQASSSADVMVPQEGQSLMLTAGEQATVSTMGVIQRRVNADVGAATSWLQQELIFQGESLDAVVDEFNRYARRPIVLADPSLANLRINAVFHTTDPESLLRFVVRFDGVEVKKSDTEIVISRKELQQ